MKLNIVLHEPEIPQNTGNIARTCAATGAALHMIRPLGFRIDDAKLKRAGLDYWHSLDIFYYDGFDEFFAAHPDAQFYCFSTKAPRPYTAVRYPDDCYLIFGKETRGLPEDFLRENYDRCSTNSTGCLRARTYLNKRRRRGGARGTRGHGSFLERKEPKELHTGQHTG